MARQNKCIIIIIIINKATISDIIIPLTIIFYKSLASGQFPDSLKLAKVIPIHKGDDIKQVICFTFFQKY